MFWKIVFQRIWKRGLELVVFFVMAFRATFGTTFCGALRCFLKWISKWFCGALEKKCMGFAKVLESVFRCFLFVVDQEAGGSCHRD